jgi:hypothetical protein
LINNRAILGVMALVTVLREDKRKAEIQFHYYDWRRLTGNSKANDCQKRGRPYPPVELNRIWQWLISKSEQYWPPGKNPGEED